LKSKIEKILITGGTGFLGSYIIKELIEKNHAVRAIRRSTSKLPFYIPQEIFCKVEWVEGDVLDVISLEKAMEGVETVIHSAAVISFLKKEKKWMDQVNIEGTANVVNMAMEKNISRLVHISSVAALGRTKEGAPVSEESEWIESRNNSQYAVSKYRSEMEVWRGVAEGLPAAIVNPSIILGSSYWHDGSGALGARMVGSQVLIGGASELVG